MFGERTLLATAFYLTGYLCHKMDFPSRQSLATCLFFFVAPAALALFVHLSMATAEGLGVMVIYPVALSGTFGMIILSGILSRKSVAPVLAYIGSRTLYILTFHFLAFKLVSFIWIKVHGISLSHLSEAPVLRETNTWMWIMYSIAGVSLPLLLRELFRLPEVLLKRIKENR